MAVRPNQSHPPSGDTFLVYDQGMVTAKMAVYRESWQHRVRTNGEQRTAERSAAEARHGKCEGDGFYPCGMEVSCGQKAAQQNRRSPPTSAPAGRCKPSGVQRQMQYGRKRTNAVQDLTIEHMVLMEVQAVPKVRVQSVAGIARFDDEHDDKVGMQIGSWPTNRGRTRGGQPRVGRGTGVQPRIGRPSPGA